MLGGPDSFAEGKYDRTPVGELAEGDPVASARELELDAVVDEPLALQPFARADLDDEVDVVLLDHARADARLDVLATPIFEDDGVDALPIENVPERETRWSGADDPDLRPGGRHSFLSSSSTRWAIAKAPLAAGTPQ